jgi:hypothetical protein
MLHILAVHGHISKVGFLSKTCIDMHIVQGGAVNRGLKRFFSLYRSLHLIEAYVWPEKYWLVWAGTLANHPFNFNFIFLSDGTMAATERAACLADLYRR